jgi:hypothetical protein
MIRAAVERNKKRLNHIHMLISQHQCRVRCDGSLRLYASTHRQAKGKQDGQRVRVIADTCIKVMNGESEGGTVALVFAEPKDAPNLPIGQKYDKLYLFYPYPYHLL